MVFADLGSRQIVCGRTKSWIVGDRLAHDWKGQSLCATSLRRLAITPTQRSPSTAVICTWARSVGSSLALPVRTSTVPLPQAFIVFQEDGSATQIASGLRAILGLAFDSTTSPVRPAISDLRPRNGQPCATGSKWDPGTDCHKPYIPVRTNDWA